MPRVVIVLALAFLGFLIWAALPEEQQAQTPMPTPQATPTSAPSPTPGPRSIIAEADDLTLTLELDDTQGLEGGTLPARLIVRNNHTQKVLTIQTHHTLTMLPNGEGPRGQGWYGELPGETKAEFQKVQPRQSLTLSVPLYIPVLKHNESLLMVWAQVYYDLDPPRAGDSYSRLEVGPLPISVVPAAQDQQLISRLSIDSAGWTLQVQRKDGLAAPEAHAALEITTTDGYFYPEQAGRIVDGWGTGKWGTHYDGKPAEVRALVTAPGFSSEIVTASLDLEEHMTRYTEETFVMQSRQEVELFLGVEVADLISAELSAPPELLSASVVSSTYRYGPADGRETDRYQTIMLKYRLGDAREVTLSQTISEQQAFFGYGDMPGVEIVTLERDEKAERAYLESSFGRWSLRWDRKYQQISLSAAAADFTRAELMELARHVRVPRDLNQGLR